MKLITFVCLTLLCVSPVIVKAQQGKKPLSGKELYVQRCMTCHQADGTGAQNMIPPLVRTEYVLGGKSRLIGILLNGMNGDITVNGDMYSNEMPSQRDLQDKEIAAVLTYVRSNFGNTATAVTAAEVKKARAATKTNKLKKNL